MKPLISIITVTYNIENTIERTIKSILGQSFTNFEYIIVDGKSTDSTISIIKKYENKLSHFVCEPDKGLYDAMNKATTLATGKWVQYIQGDDYLLDKNSLNKIAPILEESKADVVYGNAIYTFDWGQKRHMKGKNIGLMWKIMPFNHQATFTKTELIKKYPFNLKYKTAADYDNFYNLYQKGHKFEYVDLDIAGGDLGGRSDRNRIYGLKEVLKIKQSYDSNQIHIMLHRLHILRSSVNLFVKSLLPDKLVEKIISSREEKKNGK